jgi:hypothetical protein
MQCGWATPAQFLRIGASLPADRRWERHRDACRIRLENPAYFLAPPSYLDATLRAFYMKHMPIAYLLNREHPVIRSDPETVDTALSLLFDYFFSRFTWEVMLADDLDFHDMFPPRVAFEKLFDNIRSTADLLDLLRQSNQLWLCPESFERFGT